MKKILIIEDEKEIRNILRVYLNACGYEVEEAEDIIGTPFGLLRKK